MLTVTLAAASIGFVAANQHHWIKEESLEKKIRDLFTKTQEACDPIKGLKAQLTRLKEEYSTCLSNNTCSQDLIKKIEHMYEETSTKHSSCVEAQNSYQEACLNNGDDLCTLQQDS